LQIGKNDNRGFYIVNAKWDNYDLVRFGVQKITPKSKRGYGKSTKSVVAVKKPLKISGLMTAWS
jgi:hypothetical protein